MMIANIQSGHKRLFKMDIFFKTILELKQMIRAYSYNGAKFDNHFVLNYIKQMHGDEWINEVVITGDNADMKIITYNKSVVFCDLKLMTGG